jgi:ABC-type cobalamin/Fe3+-siderophores transport system ATPase subunit
MQEISIPKARQPENYNINVHKNLVIVGANGAGKSKFGANIEQNNNPSKRISAQRYLSLTENVAKVSYGQAEKQLRGAFKNQSTTSPQNDYNQVLISLFAEESMRDSGYIKQMKESDKRLPIPLSVKESVIEIWNQLFPYRPLLLENDKVRARAEMEEFSAEHMSEGEKVGLYLISQILLADKNCTLIIDEPELHLHKSLMTRLWNLLESNRTDCIFIYITHDLDFAVSKTNEKIIWIRSYTNNSWDYIELEPDGEIPENLYLEILGSRKPVLLIEGNKGSLDSQIYQSFYTDLTIIPCGSCNRVVEAVKSLNAVSALHKNKISGLIDRDFRSENQVEALQKNNIHCLKVNQIENLFLIPEILKMVCQHMNNIPAEHEIINEIRNIYDSEVNSLKFMISKSNFFRKVGETFGAIKSFEQYEHLKNELFPALDKLKVDKIPAKDEDLMSLLMFYPHKGLVQRVQSKLDLTKNGYMNIVKSFLTSSKRSEIVDILKKNLPSI